jgi:hypothetical protein
MSTTLITGLPRSGTSLACACLNTLPDCVALVEPMDVPVHGDVNRAVIEIIDFAKITRASIIEKRIARTKTVDGRISDNLFEEASTQGLRRDRHELRDVPIAKTLSSDFRLFIKHPAIFTALAHELVKLFPVFAIIRHPLAVLASWDSVETDFRRGRLPVAEAFGEGLAEELDHAPDTLARQVALLRWMFRIYAKLPRSQVVTYESIIADPTNALAPLVGSKSRITHQVLQFDIRERYPNADLPRIARALLEMEQDVVSFYPDFYAGLQPYLNP